MIELSGPSRHPLLFNWVCESGVWRQTWEAYIEYPMPVPVPDYAPGELERIEAAEKKRERRAKRG